MRDFSDILGANQAYAEQFHVPGLRAQAARGLAIVTCMDTRLAPLRMLGLQPGDAKILRNAGARVTDDVLRSLVLAVHFLGVTRVALIGHTQCRMTESTNEEMQTAIAESTGAPVDWDFLAVADQRATLQRDLRTVRDCPLIPPDVVLGAFLYDVATGALTPEGTA